MSVVFHECFGKQALLGKSGLIDVDALNGPRVLVEPAAIISPYSAI